MSKKKRLDRLLSLALAFAMVLTLLPVTALAAPATVDSWDALVAAYGSDGGKTITIPTGTTVTVTDGLYVPDDGEMYTLTGGGTLKSAGGFESMIAIFSGAKLTLENVTLDGGGSHTGCMVYIDGGAFTMTSGSITNNEGDGVGVYSGGTFTMTDGSITDNAGNYAGGVDVFGGTFTMFGGSITDNAGNYAGGVCADDGMFTMTGGSITGNTGETGGVSVSGGMFTMTGGSITGNTGETGGVYVYGEFTMSDGSIAGNTGYSTGGVYVGGEFTMSGGSISGNTGTGDGMGIMIGLNGAGGVGVNGPFYLSGGAHVTGNTFDGAASNVGLFAGNPITITGELTGAVGITANSPVSPAIVAVPGENHAITLDDLACLSSDHETEISLHKDGYVEMGTPISIAFAQVELVGLEGENGYYYTTYNGQPQAPTAVIVTIGDDTLTEGTDYTWKIASKDGAYLQIIDTYISGGKNAGMVFIEVTGKGAYSGTALTGYYIEPKEITVTGATVKDSVYGSLPQVDSVTFDGLILEETLTLNGDYLVNVFPAGSDPIAVGNNNVTVSVELLPIQNGRNYTFAWDEDSWSLLDTASATWKVTAAQLTGTVLIGVDDDTGDGTINEGDILFALESTNNDGTAALAYQWYRNDEALDDGDGSIYILRADTVVNDRITVEVTASGNYEGSLISAPIVVGKKPLSGWIEIIGDQAPPFAGDTLTLDLSHIAGTGTPTYSIQWYRDGAEIPGATNAAYTLTNADFGKLITAVVTGTGDYTGAATRSIFIDITEPDAPVLTATAGDGQVTLSWEPPFDGGSPIVTYRLFVFEGEYNPNRPPISYNTYTFGPSVTSYTVTGLENGTLYSFGLMARNAHDFNSGEPNFVTATPTAGGGNDGPSGGGGGSTAPERTIPAADGAVAVNFTQKGETVTLDLPAAKVAEIIKAAQDGTASFDLSRVRNTGEVVIPASALKALSEAGLDVEIILPQGTVTLDSDALDTAAASGGNVTVSLTQLSPETLTQAQRAQLKPGDVVFDISLMAGTTVIHELNGTVTVTLPYDGELPVAVWYLNDAGELEKLECTYRKGFVTFTTDHLSLYVLGQDTAGQNPFTDVAESAWYFDAVQYVYENGVMSGTGGSLFAPNTTLSRAMMVQILYNIEGQPASGSAGFDDVSDTAWYANAVTWAAENDIVKGVGQGLFAPDAAVTREQMAVMLYNYCVFKGIELPTLREDGAFADADMISSWAVEAVEAMYKAEILSGKGDNLFDPQGTATRAEVAAMLHNFLEAIG